MTLLLVQMSVVLAVTLICGWLAQRMGQARVIGEIIGGILLGPSVLGRLTPETSQRLFPAGSLGGFDVLSTVGLVLFLFVIGMDLNLESLSRHKGTAALTSTMSIVLPFAMALGLAPPLRARFAPEGVGALAFALFLGVSLSITAFPVLARILKERNLQQTSLGSTALLCAAVDDVCAWTLLAVALELLPHGGTTGGVGWRLLWLGLYVAFMFALVRPLAARLADRWRGGVLSYEAFGVILALVLVSAEATDVIGVHPLFGAFLAGLCFPRVPEWVNSIKMRLEMVVSVLLLPFFFALTGMKTRLDLLRGGEVWMWTAVVLGAAVVGKMGGAALAARWTGESWRNAFALGALLNTRGLVELVVLNIAYNAGVFSPTLFSILVAMALATTMMTTPLLDMLRVTSNESARTAEHHTA